LSTKSIIYALTDREHHFPIFYADLRKVCKIAQKQLNYTKTHKITHKIMQKIPPSLIIIISANRQTCSKTPL